MLIGVPKEIKNHEYRVGLTPGSVRELVAHGHKVLVETGAGNGIGMNDTDYTNAGATISPTAQRIFAEAELVVKVKEPQAAERKLLRKGQVLFTYLHLAPDPEQTKDLIASGATCIAYETVTSARGGLPLLAPMSEVAGRMSIQAGATALQKAHGGRGVLLGGVPGVEPGKVVILGGGVVGSHAADMAVGLGADVTVVDRSIDVLRVINAHWGGRVKTVVSTRANIERLLLDADLVIGGVLIPGAAAPKLVSADMIKRMQPGSVVVDVAIDQGGCFETSHATTHAEPTYVVDGVVHYCVANMPGAVPRTSTFALNNVTLPFVIDLAGKGWRRALIEDAHLLNGLNVHDGKLTSHEVAEALGMDHVAAREVVDESHMTELLKYVDADQLRMLEHLVLALGAGALIGMERSYHGRPAGFRTHALVCLASALLMTVTLYQHLWFKAVGLERVTLDPTRLAQGIMTGIGFLGAGVIMKEGLSVRGLTTAASIWITSAIGILIGVGFYFPAAIATVLVLSTLTVLRWIELKMPSLFYAQLIVRFKADNNMPEPDLRALVSAHGFSVANLNYRLDRDAGFFEYRMAMRSSKSSDARHLSEQLTQLDKVVEFRISPAGD